MYVDCLSSTPKVMGSSHAMGRSNTLWQNNGLHLCLNSLFKLKIRFWLYFVPDRSAQSVKLHLDFRSVFDLLNKQHMTLLVLFLFYGLSIPAITRANTSYLYCTGGKMFRYFINQSNKQAFGGIINVSIVQALFQATNFPANFILNSIMSFAPRLSCNEEKRN